LEEIVLPHEETKLQVENTEVQLVTFQMATGHIENKEALTSSIRSFLKLLKTSAFKYPLTNSSLLLR
jgi:hypothetical protein